MSIHIGHVHQLVRYPVKSMAGVATESAVLGWHGFEGDRRFAFRRVNDDSGFPWLSASRLPELLLYQPIGFDENAKEPARVRTPDGVELALESTQLRNSISEKCGQAVELMKLRHGIFDEASVSVINLATISAIGREAQRDLDTRRFRANIFLQTESTDSFLEDAWVGSTLAFGNDGVGPVVSIMMRDERCSMINLDPDTTQSDPQIMKTVVRLNANCAGVYGTVLRPGPINIGDSVTLIPSVEHG